MLLWFIGGAVLAVWAVFKDPRIDFRLVAVGALLPDVLDIVTGQRWFGHTVLGNVTFLVAVMLATIGRRERRRRLLALPIGSFLHLALDGMWADRDVFWWPVFGTSFGDQDLPSIERGLANLPLEVLGLVAITWAARRKLFTSKS